MGKSQSPKKYLFWTWDGTGVPPLSSTAVAAPEGKGASGYGVRVDDATTGRRWKGVLPHCNAGGKPTATDALQLYDIVADPFETTNIAAANQDQVHAILTILISEGVTCACFQC